MNKFLNVTRILLSLIAVTIYMFLSLATSNNPLSVIIHLLLAIFIFFTTIIDVCKKRTFNIKHNIIINALLLIILFIMLRPLIDVILIKATYVPVYLDLFLIALYKNHNNLITILFTIILSLNYIDYKKSN